MEPSLRKIYGTAKSRAIRPIWMAEELGLTYEHIPTSFLNGGTRTPELMVLNPNGHIPVLVEPMDQAAPLVMFESLAINLYLAQSYGSGDDGLWPAQARSQAACLQWSFWAANECEKDAVTIILHRVALPETKRDPSFAEKAAQRLTTPLAVLEQHLQQQAATGDAYLCENRFTVADLNLASILMWIKPDKALCAQFPAVLQWLGTCLQRPAFIRARSLP